MAHLLQTGEKVGDEDTLPPEFTAALEQLTLKMDQNECSDDSAYGAASDYESEWDPLPGEPCLKQSIRWMAPPGGFAGFNYDVHGPTQDVFGKRLPTISITTNNLRLQQRLESRVFYKYQCSVEDLRRFISDREILCRKACAAAAQALHRSDMDLSRKYYGLPVEEQLWSPVENFFSVYTHGTREVKAVYILNLEYADNVASFPGFTELPRELREQVYEEYLEHMDHGYVPLGNEQPPLACTNRQMRGEVLQLFYESRPFKVLVQDNDVDEYRGSIWYENITRAIPRLSMKHIHHLRNLHLEIGINSGYHRQYEVTLDISLGAEPEACKLFIKIHDEWETETESAEAHMEIAYWQFVGICSDLANRPKEARWQEADFERLVRLVRGYLAGANVHSDDSFVDDQYLAREGAATIADAETDGGFINTKTKHSKIGQHPLTRLLGP